MQPLPPVGMNGQMIPDDLDKGPSFSFRSEFKKLMFSADKKPLIMSGDKEKLIKVMAVISSYEKEVKVACCTTG